MVSKKHVFWQALLSAILIFGVGILMGIAFEEARNRDVERNLLDSEINLLDSKLTGIVTGEFDVSCELAKGKLIGFADDIFLEARQLEDYDESSQLTDVLELLHKRYDLLRMDLWTQAINLKDKCGDFHTVVYIYQFKDPSFDLESEQLVFSRVLEELKREYGREIILIPMAGDLGLNSIDLVKDSYGIEDYPAVILDEKVVIREIGDLAGIEDILFID